MLSGEKLPFSHGITVPVEPLARMGAISMSGYEKDQFEMKYMPDADIFDVDAECIINPVNCQAHKLQSGWQKGLAGAFEEKFPAIQQPFKKACQEGT